MHWFWRAAIADTLVIIPLWAFLSFGSATPRTVFATGMLASMVVVAVSIPLLAIFAYLSQWYAPQAAIDSETRCRKCRYILRGISEPRCPECGERI